MRVQHGAWLQQAVRTADTTLLHFHKSQLTHLKFGHKDNSDPLAHSTSDKKNQKKPGLGKADNRGLEFHPDLTPVQGLKYLGHFPFLPHTYEQALDLK